MLLVFGAINMDFVFRTPALPGVGDTVWSEDGRAQPGGKGANAAVAAARDGARVAIAGAVGRDRLADAALAGLQDAGVDLAAITRVDADTGRAAQCLTPFGDAFLMVEPGANRFARAEHVPDALLGPGTTLLAQLEVPPEQAAALVARARARGCRVVLHASPPRPIAVAALQAADVLLGSGHDLAWLAEHLGTGNNPASLHGALGVTVVRMMGLQGSDAMTPDGFRRMPGPVVRRRDATGAGDCFAGVLAGGLDRGLTIDAALRRATVAAALSVTRTGAQTGMPDTAEIDAAMPDAPELSRTEPEMAD